MNEPSRTPINFTIFRDGFRLYTECVLARRIDEVFAFFSDASNLDRITPPRLSCQIISPRPIDMKVGTRIDYRLRLRGIPLRWQSEITQWEPPHCFVDEQRRGPYRWWIHEHRFSAEGETTRTIDNVDYGVVGGAWVNRLFVQPDLRRIFEYRAEKLIRTFSQPPD